MKRWVTLSLFLIVFTAPAYGKGVPLSKPKTSKTSTALAAQEAQLKKSLNALRAEIGQIENQLADETGSQADVQRQISLINRLISLQRKESSLSKQRLVLIERTIKELENRSAELQQRIRAQQRALHAVLSTLATYSNENGNFQDWITEEAQWTPVELFFEETINAAASDLATYRADYEDALYLQEQILDEQQTLSYFLKDLEEQEEVLKLNKKIQIEFLTKRSSESIATYRKFRKLKENENHLNTMLSEFNARSELRALETEKRKQIRSETGLLSADFLRLKGKLPMPVQGTLVTQFGQNLDSQSGMKIFKKGLEIKPFSPEIRAIYSGKVAFAGPMTDLGQVIIVDHGGSYYSLSARLEATEVKAGDIVAPGQVIGKIHLTGDPFYFEIRAKNLPVNPLHWISTSTSFTITE